MYEYRGLFPKAWTYYKWTLIGTIYNIFMHLTLSKVS